MVFGGMLLLAMLLLELIFRQHVVAEEHRHPALTQSEVVRELGAQLRLDLRDELQKIRQDLKNELKQELRQELQIELQRR